MTDERRARFKKVIRQRQPDLTVILENVHDPHNIGAVMRTCESVGIGEIFVLYTETDEKHLREGKKSASSAKKWVDIHFYKDKKACFEHVRRKCKRVYAQMGMVKSLNISVACAVTLYEALRQRIQTGKYNTSLLTEAEQEAMFEDYARRGVRTQ